MRYRFLAIGLAVLCACGGKKKSGGEGAKAAGGPATLTATAETFYDDKGKEQIRIQADTAPRSPITVEVHPGSGWKHDVTTDAKGHATLVDEWWDQFERDEKLEAHLSTYVLEKGNLETTVPIKRAFSVNFYGSGFRCKPDGCFGGITLDGFKAGKLPPGTVVELGSQKVTATSDTLTIPFDTAAFARKVGAGKLLNIYGMPKDTSDPLPLAITFPDGKHFAGQAQLDARTVGQMIRGAIHQTGPISLGAAGDAGGGRRGLILIDDRIDDIARGFGTLDGLDDIDLIAIQHQTSKNVGCGTYVNTKTGATQSGETTISDYDVTVNDRRTGKQVAHRFFKDTASCASHVTQAAGSGTVNAIGSGGGVAGDVDKWLKSQVKG